MDFLLLGPLEVRNSHGPLPLGGLKQRSLLALLVLNANRVVSRDRLVDELWGERPPDTAKTALHGHVSQLRKLLEPARAPGAPGSVLVTRDPGYLLAVAPEQLDVARFEQLVEQSHTERPAEAAATLRRALELWRGPALADLADEPFAQAEVTRLDELRLTALEQCFDAELACGRHRELVPELEAAVGANPLRERLYGQLMLALYRCGRQADALSVYRDARRLLVDELGIEPGPDLRRLEHGLLVQDPALELPAPTGPVAVVRRSRRAVVAAIAGALAVMVAGWSALVDPSSTTPQGAAAGIGGSVLAAVDPGTHRVLDRTPVGGTPTVVAVGEGKVWTLNADDQTISRLDPVTGTVKTFGTGGVPTDLTVGAGSLWVVNGAPRPGTQFSGPMPASVSRVDVHSTAVLGTVGLPRPQGVRSNRALHHLAATRDAVWAINADRSLTRIDPERDAAVARIRSVQANAVTADGGGAWIVETDGGVARISARTNRVTVRRRVSAAGLSAIAVGAGAVWATAPSEGMLWRVAPGERKRAIAVGSGATDVAVGEDGVWVVNGLRGTLVRIDPQTLRIVATTRLGGLPRAVAYGGGRVWVADAGVPGRSLPAVGATSQAAQRGALPAGTCGPVRFGGKGTPDALVVSDLPLRMGPKAPVAQMSEAIEFVLRRRGFAAGELGIGYQACDNSTSQSRIYDEQKCAANARAAAANPRVLGVIGPYNSGCAHLAIPPANRAGLAVISPTATDPALSEGRPDTFARIGTRDDHVAAAGAELASQLGLRRIFVLDDGSSWARPRAQYFRRAAARFGVAVAGSSSWRPDAATYRALARRVERSGADGVYLSGLLDNNGGAVVRALRTALGRDTTLIANTGMLPIAGLFADAGPAARGVYVTLEGMATEALPPAGRRFAEQFAATQPGRPVDPASVYAAQAAEMLLDAVARSDGSRAAVTRELLGAQVVDGLLGSFALDGNGDPTSYPVTIVRAQRGGAPGRILGTEGATIDRVIRRGASASTSQR